MDDLFYELWNVTEHAAGGNFEIARANAILRAIERHRDFKVMQLFDSAPTFKEKFACVVVDVECDAVPGKNRHGIQYCERLALYIPENDKQLVNVFAIRKEFPRVLHQNRSSEGSLSSLCLYYEAPSVVTRTWTPQNLLARIQWWLENSALDTLHPAEQAVEQLFFVSDYEIVLPWNFVNLQAEQKNFSVEYQPPRPDGGQTYFLKAVPGSGRIPVHATKPLELNLPPLLHGQVEYDPHTLGDLEKMLRERNVDLIKLLREQVQTEVGTGGRPKASDPQFTIIFLNIPIVREIGGRIERTEVRALYFDIGLLKLGQAINALLVHNENYFQDALGACDLSAEATWRQLRLSPMTVLRQNTQEDARRQSGIAKPGPNATVIGAGAIGSALLDIWARSGWGKWTVIDKDHIKPHNLVRHTADARHIGMSKVDAIQQIHQEITAGASEINILYADACDLENDLTRSSINTASLIIDASAALDYPRRASSIEGLARHISVFLTPSGNAAVLMAEDTERQLRLRTLEAQYYRALVHEAWGSDHLVGNLGTYWSGASCRDISMVLPYSRVLGHAGNLADQIQLASQDQDALIRVWTRDTMSGAVVTNTVPVFPEVAHSFGELTLYIDDGVIAHLRELRNSCSPNETGGVLIGYYDLNLNTVVIVDGLQAPADSISTPTSFERGVEGLPAAIEEVAKRTAGIVSYVGEWHSHPPGHSADPSGDDISQLTYLALGMAYDGLPAVSIIVGENDIQILQGTAKA